MKAKLSLKIAAGFILLKVIGHTFGHFIWDKPDDPKMMEVVTTMKGYKAEFMGATQSMADYYNGYSLMILCLYSMTIFILWFASGFISEQRTIANKILYPFGIAYLIFGVLEFLYFFPFAASLSFLAGVLILLSVAVSKR